MSLKHQKSPGGAADWQPNQIPMIRYKGPFDWEGLYRLVRIWIEDNKYKYYEKRYKHKGDEIEVDMVGQRKIDEMHRNNIAIHFHIWNIREIDVIEGTKTIRRNTGLLHVEMHGGVEDDFQERFQESKFTRKLYKWWQTIRQKEFNAIYLERISMDLYELHTLIKTFLNMNTDDNYYK